MSDLQSARFTITPDDVVDAYRLATKYRGLTTAIVFTTGLVVAIVWRIILGGPWVAVLHMIGVFIVIYLAALITGWVQIAFDRLISLPRRSKRIYQQEKTWHAEQYLSWGKLGLSIKSVEGEFTIAWHDFTKRKEDKRMLLLYLSDIRFHILPKRYFGAANIAALRIYTDAIRVEPGQ